MLSFPTFCNQSISSATVKCPLGILQLDTCPLGVHRLEYKSTDTIDSNCDVSIESSHENLTDPAKIVFDWIRTYFEQPEKLDQNSFPNFCFIPPPTADVRFTDKVLAELMKIPFGETCTYGELAKRAGNEKASRVVGAVMKSNPACLIIPCHRVILKSGEIGRYSGGKRDGLKEWLIKYEAEKAGKEKDTE